MEIIFKKLPKMSKDEKMQKSKEIFFEEKESRKKGNPKEVIYIDPEYIRECNLYLKTDPKSIFEDNSEMEVQKYNQNFPMLIQNPQMFDAREAARIYIEKNDLPDELLMEDQQQPTPAMPNSGQSAPPQGLMDRLGIGQGNPKIPQELNQEMAARMPQLAQGV